LENQRVDQRRVRTDRVKRDPDFARTKHQRNSRPQTASHHTASARVQFSNCLIQCVAALPERMPFRRISQLRDDHSDETKHSQPLDNVEPDNGNDPDQRSD